MNSMMKSHSTRRYAVKDWALLELGLIIGERGPLRVSTLDKELSSRASHEIWEISPRRELNKRARYFGLDFVTIEVASSRSWPCIFNVLSAGVLLTLCVFVLNWDLVPFVFLWCSERILIQKQSGLNDNTAIFLAIRISRSWMIVSLWCVQDLLDGAPKA